MLRYKPPFFSKKRWFLKTVESSYVPSHSLLYLQKYLMNHNKIYILMIRKFAICDALRDLVSFVQLKKTKINTPPWVFFTFLKLYKWYQIVQRTTFNFESLYVDFTDSTERETLEKLVWYRSSRTECDTGWLQCFTRYIWKAFIDTVGHLIL